MTLTLRALIEHRRQELLQFLSWRFGTRYWTGPFAYITGLPRWLARKLQCRPIEFSTKGRPNNVLTIRDVLRLEDAALLLGFRPTLPKKVDKRYLRPPPPNLPAPTDPSVRIRFREWQKANPRDKVRKSERKRRQTLPVEKGEKTCTVPEQMPSQQSPEPAQKYNSTGASGSESGTEAFFPQDL